MKLSKIQVTNFRSIEDSAEFEIGGLTCLVGKNEAGKTAILRAIHGLSPLNPFSYDKTRDYPRRHLAKFDERHPGGESPVTSAWWTLDDSDVAVVEAALGTGVLTSREVVVTSYIGRNETTWVLPCNEKACIAHFETKHGLTAKDKVPLKGVETTKKAAAALSAVTERTEAQEGMLKSLAALREGSAEFAMLDLLSKRKPKFFYTSHFERMSGEVSLNQLAADVQQNKVSPGDTIFLDFLEYAGTTIEELRDAKKYEDLVAQCEGASNDITDEIFQFWSQNEALSVKIELGEGRAEDPPPFNTGRVAKVRIENRNHRVSVPLSERSAGFVWFFSFLSQFKQLKKTAGNAILLLDEPGLTLHGKAQAGVVRISVCEA